MAMHSMQQQIQNGLSWRTTLLMLMLWSLSLAGVNYWAYQWMADELAADSKQLISMTSIVDGEVKIDSLTHRVNFIQPLSGHYYVLHAQQGKHISSESLDGFVIQLPQRVGHEAVLFNAKGPADTNLLVHFAEYDMDGRWLDVAVARDNSVMQTALHHFNLLYSLACIVFLLVLVFWQRSLVSQRFMLLKTLEKNLTLNGLQASLFAKKWPSEWMVLADRLHQAMIQLRAHMVRSDEPDDSYQVTWPQDLQKVIEPFRNSHPNMDIQFTLKSKSFNLLVAQGDLEALVKHLLGNAAQWGRSQIWVTVTHLDGQLCFMVEDDGEGMDPERVTQIQQRNANKVPGEAASGLMIVEDIVRAYQGKLEFGHSETLGGLRVKLCLNRPNY